MSVSRSNKRELERLRQERAARKIEKRKARSEIAAGEAIDDVDRVPEDVILGQLKDLHQRFADDLIASDEFESERDRLLAQLRVD